MKVISGSSNPQLAQAIAQQLNLSLVDVEIGKFGNDEKRVWIKDQIKGQNIVIVQSLSKPVDENLVELLLLIDALERLGARHINVVLPWMGYSLQDKVFRDGEPISAKVVANLISTSHVKRVFVLDLHNTSTPGFFSVPTHHLTALDTFANYARQNFNQNEIVVASPDFGGLKRARVFADTLQTDLVNIDKHRDLKTGEVTAVGLHGIVENKTVLLFDDCIQSGGTVTESAELLKKEGAKEVHFFATHGPLVETAYAKLNESAYVDSVVVTNSIQAQQTSSKIKFVDISPLFAQALKDWI
jgi:ribose-phosphate pyrophosphokinase